MNEYDDLITNSLQTDAAQSARVGFSIAADTNPEAYAEARRVAKSTGVPVDTALNLPQEMKRQDRIGQIDFDTLAKTSPATAALLADIDKAKVAHDNVDSLTGIESALYALGKFEVGTVKAIASAVPKFNEGLFGVLRAASDTFIPDVLGRKYVSDFFAQENVRSRRIADSQMPKSDNLVESSWYSGMQSLGLNALLLPAAVAGGGPAPLLWGMGLTTGGQAYGEARDKGLGVVPSLAFGASQGVIEAGTEMIGMPALFSILKPGSFGKKALEYLIKDQGGEQIATHLQDLNEWAALNPDKSFGDYLAERPSAIVQTALATAFGGGGQVALMKGIEVIARRNDMRVGQADQSAEIIDRLNQMAAADKLLQRDPETFEAFVAQAAENGPVQQVFLDAQTLMQSGVAEQLAEISPSVAAQFAEAAQTGGQIAIPVEEYAARIAPTEYAQGLLDHLKTEPEGFSRAEAKEYLQNGTAELQADVERVLGEKQDDDTFKQSAEAVRGEIRSQLDTAARFTPQVNEAYSAMVGNFYAVTAAKLGTTPEELFQRYPLRIGAESVAGEQQFEQSGTLDEVRQQWDAAGITHTLSESNGVITVSKIVVPDGERGAGKGTAAMQVLIDYADRTGQHVALSPSSDFGGNKKRLVQFYKRFGFIENKGKNRAFTTTESMYRQAAGKVLHQSSAVTSATPEREVRNLTEAKEAAQVFLGKPLHNAATGLDATVSKTTLGKMTSQKAVAKSTTAEDHALAVANLDKLFANAQLDHSHKDAKGEPTIYAVHRYYAPMISSNGSVVAVKMTVKETTGPNEPNPLYTVETIDVEKPTLAAPSEGGIERGIGAEGVATTPTGGLSSNVVESMNRVKRALFQNQEAPRGSFNPATLSISLLKGADLSTFLHESAHFFLEVQADLVAQLQQEAEILGIDTLKPGERQMVEDTNALLTWFGIKSMNEWRALDFEEKRSYHEQFARGFESYLFEGKAPSIEMQGLFSKFRAWLLSVYRELKNLNVEITDEVRAVFDRMLATTEQIQLAEQGRSMMPLFASPEQAGMTPEEFAAYQALGVEATNDAIQDLQGRGLRDMQWLHNARGRIIKKLQADAKEQRAAVQMDVRRDVMSRPIYQAWQFLTGKETEGGEPVGKLSRQSLDEMYGGAADGKRDKYALLDWKRLTDLRMTAEEGEHPDMVAERFGFSSGDELVRRLLAAEKPDVEIEALTDVRMLEQFGDLFSPEAIEKAADKAIHNDARARMIATEANALAKATGKRRTLAEAAKEYAGAMIARLKVRHIKPGQYANAEVRAAKAAEKASKGGDLATAAAEKRNQLIQNYATRAAYDAQEEVDKGLRYLKKFDGEVKGLSADYAEQIGNLLERFDLRKQSNRAVDRKIALSAWLAAQREAGFEPSIPPDLENEALRKSYKEMTVEEFRGLVDTVRQIEHLGRLKNKLLTAKDQREYEAIRDEIAGSIRENANGREAETRTPTTNMGRSVQGLKRFWAAHIKAATWARVMDGGKDGGPMWEYFVRSANERGDQETTMRAEATARLSEILAPVFKLGRMGGKGQYFPGINRSLNREARIAIALNVGNAGNLQRLLGGEGWTEAAIAPVLRSLTAREWQAVQAVWDHFESYRPRIAEKERRVYGKEPDWVAPQSLTVTTADGQTLTLRGGYYPIKYDPAASQRAEEHADAEGAKRQLQGAYTTATTRRSFTKSRAEEVQGRPLLYTLSGLYSGVNDVIHDLAWHEWLIDVNRLLRSHTIDAAIREHYGPEAKQQFKTWVQDIAEGEKGSVMMVDQALSRLRQGVSAAGLGFNVMSALIQPLGITQSITRVGAPWIGRGIAKYLAGPVDLTRQVNAMSDFMANRSRTRFRELNELRNKVQSGKWIGALDEWVGSHAYFLMMRCQQMVDVPTWWGAYEKAIGEGNEETRAIALADQAVIDAQGGGQTKDLSAIERGGPAQRLFTVFYSFMNTALNVGVEKTMSANTPAKRAKLAADYAMLYVVPAILGYFLKAAITPGDSGDDDMEKIAKKLLANQIDYLMGLMVVVREFGEAAKTVAGANDMGRDYTGPAGLRLIADTVSLTKQSNQGDFDTAFRKAAVNVVGDLFGLPSAQINRTWTGIEAVADDKTDNPAAVAFGFQEKR